MSGGLGGLGGFKVGDTVGDFLGALGPALLAGNRYQWVNPEVFAQGIAAAHKRQGLRDSHQAIKSALKAVGFSDEDADTYAANPDAAKLVIEQRNQDRQAKTAGEVGSFLGGLYGGQGGGAGGVGKTAVAPETFAPLFAAKEAEYRLPSGYLAQTAKIESSFNPNAKNPRSSAGGLFQFLDSTAEQYGLDNKFDPVASTDAAARLARDNAAGLRQALGREPTAPELYLAHQQGLGGARAILGNPDAPVASLVGGQAAALNGGAGLTGREFSQKWMGAMGSGAPVQTAQATPADLPVAGGQEAQFFIPTAEPRTPGQLPMPRTDTARPGTGSLPIHDPKTAMAAIPRLYQLLAQPNLPESTRQAVRSTLEQALATVKPTERTRQLMEAGYQPGTPEYQRAYRQLVNAERIPRGFEEDPDAPGQLRPIPGGPHSRTAQKEAPAGYRWTGDGNLEAIPGGPAALRANPPPKPLPHNAVKDIAAAGGHVQEYKNLVGGFEDNFGGYGLAAFGEAANVAGRNLPGVTEERERQANWWQAYQRRKNTTRHGEFGAALTATEKAEFDKADINPGMKPSVIRENLRRQQEVVSGAAKRMAGYYVKSGRSPEEIEVALGIPLEDLGLGASGAPAGNDPPRESPVGRPVLDVGGSTTINGVTIKRVK